MNPIVALALIVALLAVYACFAVTKRGAAVAEKARRLELESLEQRREIWRLQKQKKGDSRTNPGAGDGSDRNDETLASIAVAVTRIVGELHEARVLESIARGAVEAAGATTARIVLHDRRTDRFGRGPSARRDEKGEIVIAEEPPRGTEDAVLRSAMKRRARIRRDSRDPTARGVFEAADRELAMAAPLFDRAIAAAVVLVDGDVGTVREHAIDVLAAAGSLALANARLRASSATNSAPVTELATPEQNTHA